MPQQWCWTLFIITQGFSRPWFLLPVAPILHFTLAFGLGRFSREGSPEFCSTPPSFPALGALYKFPLHWHMSWSTQAEKPFQNQHLCLYLLLEIEHNLGFASREELLVPARHSAAHPTSLCPSRFASQASLILSDNVFFLHLASQLTSKPCHI